MDWRGRSCMAVLFPGGKDAALHVKLGSLTLRLLSSSIKPLRAHGRWQIQEVDDVGGRDVGEDRSPIHKVRAGIQSHRKTPEEPVNPRLKAPLVGWNARLAGSNNSGLRDTIKVMFGVGRLPTALLMMAR